ncbi:MULTISPECIES: MFS transporter [Prauserella salsuginis group]|uniref:MFS transporter n=1 Tax=Prauserella salsuginis TaxID=387889 RepID=A0ABW6G9U0_9PSEU|nr:MULTISPECIES: MFS transporter [Prauserella salsuginis group]MCR3721419.1 MFS transporter, putative metabolite:H+ symporter [Prauserella flava]MCR3732409.1 MFS transporter, putative metabolite:H+ symporter [Prauserella salsuginis]
MKTAEQIVQDLPWKWSVQGKIFIIGGLGYMFDAWDVILNGFLTPLVGDHFGLTTGERGLVATANLVGMAVGAVMWGTIADRMGRKKAFSITLALFALFSVLGAVSPNYEIFLLFRFLAGVGLGGCIPVDYALVAEFSPRKVRGKVLAAMDLWWPIGGTLCGLSATFLSPLDGNWRWMLMIMVVPALLLFWIRRGIPESPLYLANVGREAEARVVVDRLVAQTGATAQDYSVTADEPKKEGPGGVRAALGQLRMIWTFNPKITSVAWVLFITVMTVYYVALTWMPSILKEEGYDTYAAFANTTLMTGIGILGVTTSVFLVEWMGRKWVLGLSAPLASVVLVAFSLTLGMETVGLIWLGIFGFVVQLAIPVLYAYVSELYPTHLRASGFGWASSMSRVFSGFIPLIFGSLLWPVLGLTNTFILLGAVVVVAVVWMAVAAPETKGKELDRVEEEAPDPDPTPAA